MGLAVVALAVGAGRVVSANHEKGHDGGGNKISICHFPGHDGGLKGSGDFQVWDGPKGEFHCNSLGGNVISVSVAGAENGHGVIVKGGPK